MNEEDVVQDELFVGLTRPATIGGIPYAAAVLEFMLTAIVFLGTGNPLYLLIAAPLHGILYLVSASNPRFFAELAAWVKTNALCMNRGHWGGTSFSPRKTTKWK